MSRSENHEELFIKHRVKRHTNAAQPAAPHGTGSFNGEPF